MEIISCGISGRDSTSVEQGWEDLGLETKWLQVINCLCHGTRPREIQRIAMETGMLLEGRKNLIVSAPTNSGKSLIATLAVLDAVRNGGRAVLVEPLRALAQEKTDQLKQQQPELERILARPIKTTITTGDYRLENEVFTDPPPDAGEIIVATPERLEAILRNPDFDGWVSSLATICVDEAHLLGSQRRGPTLEFVITTLKTLPVPPRILLLSASMGDVSAATRWLAPCELAHSVVRHPPLDKNLLALEDGEDADQVVVEFVSKLLQQEDACVLIFVYQTRSAEKLARTLNDNTAATEIAAAYHSKMATAARAKVRDQFSFGKIRCVVATTSLAMGINLPATHVLVRDVTFPGEGKLGADEILQMMGRAGRGDRPGTAYALVRHNDAWSSSALVDQLRNESLPKLESSFQSPRNRSDENARLVSASRLVASYLSRRRSDAKLHDVLAFSRESLAGDELGKEVNSAIHWLADPSRMLLAHVNGDALALTSLGSNAIQSTLPLSFAAGVGQLIRDLLEIDPVDKALSNWTVLDTLILLELMNETSPSLRRFSEELAGQTAGWIESSTGPKPVLYREWIRGSSTHSKAAELFGSLGIEADDAKARKLGCLATFRAIVLYDRGTGKSIADIERRWNISNFVGAEEKWRDASIWLVGSLTKIIETRCFYFHLKENCDADTERIRRVETAFRQMRRQMFGLQQHLKFCSPLGPILLSMKRVNKNGKSLGIGIQTIRKLEAAGIQTLPDLARMSEEDLRQAGVRKPAAHAIRRYVRRRMQ